MIIIPHHFNQQRNHHSSPFIIAKVALHFANEYLVPFGGCLCPPLGAVAVLLFSMAGAPASQPKAVIGGHLVSGVVSFVVMLSGIGDQWFGKGVAVSLTIVLMKLLGVTHPPAGAYAFFFVSKKFSEPQSIFFPGLAGACVLLATQAAVKSVAASLKSGAKKK